MRLKSLTYIEFPGQSQEWALERIDFGLRNLIVGRNASGKSRALNVIAALAKLLAGLAPPGIYSDYVCVFDHDGKEYRYTLKIEDEQVTEEKLSVDNNDLLIRVAGGEGSIYAEEKSEKMRFQTPTKQLAAVARRDSLQHSFLEPLYAWASSLRHHQFGTNLGKDHFALSSTINASDIDERNQVQVLGLFTRAEREFGARFTAAVLSDLESVNYYVDEIGIGAPTSLRVSGGLSDLVALYAKEKDLPGITDQLSMSQGMYRVLSLLVLANYLNLKGAESCLLVDDIGEGLDFDRSCRLINVLREKTSSSKLQLIMSSNDRFVMNEVPLEEWSILQRVGGRVTVRNNANSAELFEEFKFTGMSNFSLLELGFLDQSESSIA